MLLFFFLSYLAAVWCDLTTQPVGIRNGVNLCYLASVFQNLYALPNFRTAVLGANEASDKIHLAIAGVFAKLQMAPKSQYERDQYPSSSDNAIVIIPGFYDEYAASISGEQRNLGLEPFKFGDPDVFLMWLANVLPLFNDLVCAKLERTLAFGDVVYSSKITETVSSVQISVVDDDSKVQDLQELLDTMGSPIEGANIDRTGDETIDQHLTAAGVTFGNKYNIQEKYTVSSTGPILPILVKRNSIQFTNSKAKLQYTKTLIISKEVYHLNGLVIGKPGHFEAIVRTNICNDDWHHFNDSNTTRLREGKELSYQKEVALLFYVKKAEIEDYYEDDEDYKVDIPEAVLANLGLSKKIAPELQLATENTQNDEQDGPDKTKLGKEHADKSDPPKYTDVKSSTTEKKALIRNVSYDEPKTNFSEPDRPKECKSGVLPEYDTSYSKSLEWDESFGSFELPDFKLSESSRRYGGKTTDSDAKVAKALNDEIAEPSNFLSSRVPTWSSTPSWQSAFNDEDI